jgi:hypothetical protein
MAKRTALVVLLGFVCAAFATADSNCEIFDSWIGNHYTELGANIAGKPNYSGNSVTYDSSWTETKSQYRGSPGGESAVTGRSTSRPGETVYYKVTHERWVTVYFDEEGIITTWRSYGW